MNYKKLANLLFPNVTKTIEDYEKIYPERNLPEGAEVCLFAPSPTGLLHIGGLYTAFRAERIAHQTNGVFLLRIEDTDKKREVENVVELLIQDLNNFDYKIDEGPVIGGNYGPYIQSERKDIYAVFAKYLVSIGRAYPCFCSEESLNEMRERQEHRKERIGYYGHYAKCRNLSFDEIVEHLNNKDPYVIRLKSMGDFNQKMKYKDLVLGQIEFPQNDIDQVLLKSDGMPPYAFAHVVDDHLMRVTKIIRADEWLSSVPFHMELWEAFGFKKPGFAHVAPLNKKDGNSIRKLSKRKDPEAAVSYYHEQGIPNEAVKLYLATLFNSNFEGWLLQNPDKSYREFKFDFSKVSTTGALFDMEKLINISKNYLSRLSAKEVYNGLNKWAKEFDPEFAELVNKYPEFTTNVLNIEREQKKPRKDFAFYSEIKSNIWYMYDELFTNIKYESLVNNIEEFMTIINLYLNKYYNYADDKETWFDKIRKLAEEVGYASDMKLYKDNPDNYKGSVADISNMSRIAITTKTTTPDLYEIMLLLGENRVKSRLKNVNN